MKLSRFSIFIRLSYLAVITGGLLMLSPAAASAQTSPEQTLKTFYKWYLHEMNADRFPRRTSPKVDAAASARLRRWFRTKEGREWDADYFVDAQDFDPKWENAISTSKAVVSGNTATVTVTLGSRATKAAGGWDPHTLKIKMVKESGGWKIDHVNGY